MKDVFNTHNYRCLPGRGGSIIAGICRARLAEGIDFKDDQARLVVVVGVPLPAIGDSYVILKSSLAAAKSHVQSTFKWLEK